MSGTHFSSVAQQGVGLEIDGVLQIYPQVLGAAQANACLILTEWLVKELV